MLSILAITFFIGLTLFYFVGKMDKISKLPQGSLEHLVWCQRHHISYHETITSSLSQVLEKDTRFAILWWGEDAEGRRYRPDEYGRPKELVNVKEVMHDNCADPSSELPDTTRTD